MGRMAKKNGLIWPGGALSNFEKIFEKFFARARTRTSIELNLESSDSEIQRDSRTVNLESSDSERDSRTVNLESKWVVTSRARIF